MKIKTFILSPLIILFISTSLLSQEPVELFAFGHSLMEHRYSEVTEPSDETTINHWMYLLSLHENKTFRAGGQFGFLPQHAMLPPIAQWGYELVPGVWESDTESFEETNINTIFITAGNFIQYQSPELEYITDPGITPLSATVEIMDWVYDSKPYAKVYIYENWPDMAPFLTNGYPASDVNYSQYNQFCQREFNDWWVEYQDLLLLARPDINVRMIPVGPIIASIIQEIIEEQISPEDLYEDDAPHGRPNIYFLAGLISYIAIHDEKPNTDFDFPVSINPVIAENYNEIIDLIWNELKAFNDENEKSRVFFGNPNSLDLVVSPINSIIYPNPTNNKLNLSIEENIKDINIYDITGKLVFTQLYPPNNIIEIKDLKSGAYIIKLTLENKQKETFKIVKN